MMPYKKSKARKTLQLEFKGISERLRAVQRGSIDQGVKEYVLAASIFLAHASLENYISDVFSDSAKGIQSVAKKGGDLPDNLRSHLFLHNLNKVKIYGAAIGLNSEKEAIESLNNSLKGYAGAVVDNSRDIFILNGKHIYTNYKYPSKDNLIRVFERVGVNKIFKVLSARMKRDSAAVLESIGDLRTQLAHTGQIPGISAKDIINRIGDVESFVGAMDRVLYGIIVAKYKQAAWDGYLV